MELKSLKIDNTIKDFLNTPIDEKLKKERTVGKTSLTYISGSTVTDMLNKAFGYTWNWEVKREWIEGGHPFWNKHAENGKGAWEEQGANCHVLGTLTVFLRTEDGNIFEVKKDGYGSKSIIGRQSEQDAIFKAAGTDALKKAASLFGIGLELYRDEGEQEYFEELNYVDPWNDETNAEFEEELNYIRNYMEEYKVDEANVSEIIAYITEGKSNRLLPENIVQTVNYIKENVEG